MSRLATYTLHCFGGRLAQFSEATQEGLEAISEPSDAPNPVDVGDIASPIVYGQALDLLLADPGVDSILVIKTPGTVEETVAVADTIAQRMANHHRCIIASFPGARAGAAARQHLLDRQVPTYGTTNDAVQAFMRIVQYKRNQALLMETPPSLPEAFTPNVAAAKEILAEAMANGRQHLIEPEAMRLLAAYHIPTADLSVAYSPNEAADIAAHFNQPIALKLITPDDLAQSHVGGVVRHLHTRDAVRETAIMLLKRFECITPAIPFRGFIIQPMLPRDGAYEITMGARTSDHFGPVLYFGQGGIETDVIDDLAYGLPPLNMHLAREIMAQTRLYQRLRYSLLRRANINAVALSLVKISQMVIDLPELAELSINPLRVNARGVIALSAKVQIAPVVTHASVKRLAIRPYPKNLEETVHLSNGQAIFLRPVLPEDEPALQALALRASPEDLRLRFFLPIRELSHDLAATLTQIDYHRDMALVAVGPGLPGQAEIYGIVNLSADSDHERAEYSILIDRTLKGVGLGNLLMRRIIAYARTCGISEIHGEVLQENKGMLRLDRTLGFAIHADQDDPGVKHVVLKLHCAEVSAG